MWGLGTCSEQRPMIGACCEETLEVCRWQRRDRLRPGHCAGAFPTSHGGLLRHGQAAEAVVLSFWRNSLALCDLVILQFHCAYLTHPSRLEKLPTH